MSCVDAVRSAEIHAAVAHAIQRKRAGFEARMMSLLSRAQAQLSPAAYMSMQRELRLQMDDALAVYEGELLSTCRNACPTPDPAPLLRPPKLKPISRR